MTVQAWLKDKYGLFRQIVPGPLTDLLGGPDRAKANRIMAAVMDMKKLDMAALKGA